MDLDKQGIKLSHRLTQVQCEFCGYTNRTKNKSWFKCKWCGKRLSVKNGEAENTNG